MSLSTSTQNDPGVMLYNGKPYAVGLLWFTVQEDAGKNLIKQRIAKTKADFTATRIHIAQQQGFGWLSRGHRRGMPAAAAMIADQLVGEWHGVFEADNGWWYVQVRSDTITPNGDRFFTSEEEAYHVFQEEMQKNIWPHAYAPDKWHLSEPNTRELPLKNMLDDLATTVLSPTNITAVFGSPLVRNAVLGGLLVALLIMVAIAALSLMGSDQAMLAAQNKPALRTVAGNRPAPKLQAPQAQVNEAVSPVQLLQQCGDMAANLYMALPGWKSSLFACSLGKATMGWQQVSGLLTDARNRGVTKWPTGASITFNNRMLTVAATMGNLPRIEHSQLYTQDVALLYLEQELQPLGALQVKPVIPAAPPAPPRQNNFMGDDAPAPKPPVAPPPYLDIQLLSGFGPETIGPLLDQPGMELKQVQWRIPQAMWQYQLKWTYQMPTTARTVGQTGNTNANTNAAQGANAAPGAAAGNAVKGTTP